MSSSIEEYFQPPEWATKEEVIKAAQHYINYWKIEARQRNQQWLDALQGADNAKRCEESLRGELNRKHKEFAILQSARERDVAEIHRLKAEYAMRHSSTLRWQNGFMWYRVDGDSYIGKQAHRFGKGWYFPA